jgi:O-antigen ligase/polysaccharide polymerase Wzy-like membrane protein
MVQMSRPDRTSLPAFSATWVLMVALIVASIAIGPIVQIARIGVREVVIVLLVLLMSLLVLIPSERMLQFGFKLWIITFAFGWRTIYLTPNLNIHPSEVISLLLFLAFVSRALATHSRLDFSLPITLIFFMLFAFFGVYMGFANSVPGDVVIEEFKSFVPIALSYYIVRWGVKTQQEWESASRWAIAVGVYIGCLGLLDYFLPGLTPALTGFQGESAVTISQSYSGASFARVGFIFFGNYSAGFVIFTFIGFTIYHLIQQWRIGQDIAKRLFLIAILVIQLAGIYLSGYRGLWYSVGLFLIVYALFERRTWVWLGAGLAALTMLPSDFFNRFQSVFNPEQADSSQYDRIFRATNAYNLFLQNPLTGVGWGGSGYVHSDFIQIAANAGVFGITFFLFWFIGALWQLFWVTRQGSWASRYARLLFAIICGLIVLLAGEGLFFFVQLVMPIWFLLAMSSKLCELANQTDASAFSPPA